MRRDRPIYFVKVYPEGKEGRVLDLSRRIMSYTYTDRSKKADKLALKINNSDLSNFDDPVWRKGGILEVSCGYPGIMTDKSYCVIKSVKGGVELTIEALSQGILLHLVKKCRVWKNTTLQQLADKLQFEYRSILMYENEVKANPNLRTLGDNLQIIHASQAATTDAEFLAKLAKKFGLVFSVSKKGKISFEELDLKKPPVRTITWRGGIGDWETFSIDNDITALVGAVKAKGVDTKTKRRVEHRADNESTKRDGLMQTVEVINPETLETHYEKRVASESVEHTTTGEAGKAQVQAKAEGKFKASQRGTVKLSGTLIGDPRLSAKQIIKVEGLGKRLSGMYRLIEVKHEIVHKDAYRTLFTAKSDGHGGYQEGNNTANQASLNNEKAKDSEGAPQVERVGVINEQTLRTHYEFHKRGK